MTDDKTTSESSHYQADVSAAVAKSNLTSTAEGERPSARPPLGSMEYPHTTSIVDVMGIPKTHKKGTNQLTLRKWFREYEHFC